MPVVFYDGDVPMSLPEFGGMDTGFNYYHGADPGEYDLVALELRGRLAAACCELGARRAETVFWAADPELFRRAPVEKDMDVFFYGYGDKFRRDWMRDWSASRAASSPDVDFALGGRDFRGDVGRARLLGDVPFNAFPHAISSARINLNVTRRSHASGARVVDVPAVRARRVPVRRSCRIRYAGIERWFEPGRELLVVGDADEAVAVLPRALRRPGARRRSSAARRASACSTSTRTRIARDACSSCSASGRRTVGR